MAIDKNTSEVINLDTAIDYTHAYQAQHPDEIKAYFVGIEKINLILEHEDCIGIRIYNGYDSEAGRTNLVLVGVNANGEDMITAPIIEKLSPCPPSCDSSSPLIHI